MVLHDSKEFIERTFQNLYKEHYAQLGEYCNKMMRSDTWRVDTRNL